METSELKNVSTRKSYVNTTSWYCAYGLSIATLCVLCLAFWLAAKERKILYSQDTTLWFGDNPKVFTISWTHLSTILSHCVSFLLYRTLRLMMKQRVRNGTSLSSIEIWSRLATASLLIDRKRLWPSVYVSLNCIVAALLTTGLATLLTPNAVLVSQPIHGSEIDFTSSSFWDWYNEINSETGSPNGGNILCFWNTYESATGNTVFPTCGFVEDPVLFISSGVSAAQEELRQFNATIRVVNRLFIGSTGGVVPVGWGGISAFSDIQGELWKVNPDLPNFNYSLTQQGLSAEITCRQSSNDIAMSSNISFGVTNTAMNNRMQLASYRSHVCGGQSETMMVPTVASVGAIFCQPESNVKRFEFYLTPFGGYKDRIPEMACIIRPSMTENLVTFTSTTDLFSQYITNTHSDPSLVPKETVDAIRQLLISSITTWGNSMVDSLISVQSCNNSIKSTDVLAAMLRGIIEYEGTTLRMAYTALEAPGRRNMTGMYHVWRLGYDSRPAAFALLAPCLVFVLLLSGCYSWAGYRSHATIDGLFDPTNSISLIVAGAAGGAAEGLDFAAKGNTNPNDEAVQQIWVKYKGQAGFEISQRKPGRFEMQSLLFKPKNADL